MKIISWNVNGIRAIIKKDYFIDLINSEDPDVFCMGETKISCPFLNVQEEITEKIKSKYFHYWSPCKTRKGYSGTAIYTKKEPENVIYGLKIGDIEHDNEGRVITCEFKKYYLIHVYTPNSGQELARLEWRTETWDRMFSKFIEKLQKTKPVILCGDLNVAHKEIDLKNPKTNLRTAGFTVEERLSFDKLLKDTELVDTFRSLNPELIKYSYWTYKFQARAKNAGWRIDYFLVDKTLLKKVIKSDILDNILGSDHAPIILEIKIK